MNELVDYISGAFAPLFDSVNASWRESYEYGIAFVIIVAVLTACLVLPSLIAAVKCFVQFCRNIGGYK